MVGFWLFLVEEVEGLVSLFGDVVVCYDWFFGELMFYMMSFYVVFVEICGRY